MADAESARWKCTYARSAGTSLCHSAGHAPMPIPPPVTNRTSTAYLHPLLRRILDGSPSESDREAGINGKRYLVGLTITPLLGYH